MAHHQTLGLAAGSPKKSTMDRVYLASIPKFRASLKRLRNELSLIDTSTDWVKLRVEPLAAHVEALDRLLKSPRFAREIARLRKGVVMFHADLVYLRTNIEALRKIIADEKAKKHRA